MAFEQVDLLLGYISPAHAVIAAHTQSAALEGFKAVGFDLTLLQAPVIDAPLKLVHDQRISEVPAASDGEIQTETLPLSRIFFLTRIG